MKPALMTAVVVAVLSVISHAGATPVVPIINGLLVSEERVAGDVCGAVSGPRFAFSGCNAAAGTGGWAGPTAGVKDIGAVIGDNHAVLVMGLTFDALPDLQRGAPDFVQPFKMTGAFFGDGLDEPMDYEVIGHGLMSVLWRLHEFTTFPQWTMRFDFGGRGSSSGDGPAVFPPGRSASLSVDALVLVSEPSTIGLLGVALAIAFAVRSGRRGLRNAGTRAD